MRKLQELDYLSSKTTELYDCVNICISCKKQLTLPQKNKMISNIEQLDFTKQYTYANYLTGNFDYLLELIIGWISRINPTNKSSVRRLCISLWLYK